MVRARLRSVAARADRAIDRLSGIGNGPPLLEPYRGYATPRSIVLRGRVLTHLRRQTPGPEQSKWINLRQMAALFLTNEVAGVAVTEAPHGTTATSDAEGYLTIEVPREAHRPGWTHHLVAIDESDEAPTPFPALIPRPDAAFGVISDIDDTLMETGAYSLARNLWTTFTGSALTRHVFTDSVALIQSLGEGGRNPVFYVSSSPWNLHHFLETVFARAGLPRGPMFLRDLGVGADGHGDHKGEAIDLIVRANPDLPFVLVGDTGQHDATIYEAARKRHGDRIAAVILREAGARARAANRTSIEHLEAAGTAVFQGSDFSGLAPKVRDALASLAGPGDA